MRIAQVSYHTNPVAPLGGRHTGGMNIYVSELARELARRGHHVDIFTRLDGERPEVTSLAPTLRLVQLAAGPPAPLEKELLTPFVSAFAAEMARFAANEGETYDLVHSHYWQAIAAGEPFARAQGAPHLVMFHTLGEVKNRARSLRGGAQVSASVANASSPPPPTPSSPPADTNTTCSRATTTPTPPAW